MIRRRKRRRRSLADNHRTVLCSPMVTATAGLQAKSQESLLSGDSGERLATDGDSQIVPSADKLGNSRVGRNRALAAVHVGENTYLA
jgi:hypothetical protein